MSHGALFSLHLTNVSIRAPSLSLTKMVKVPSGVPKKKKKKKEPAAAAA